MKLRRASHSGSWYSESSERLGKQLTEWLDLIPVSANHGPARAIISPHAGYEYSASCAAFAFKQIKPDLIRRVFLIGPSHFLHLSESCALTCADFYETPFYQLKVDQQVNDRLRQTGQFSDLTASRDEEEHSIEMQLPFLAKVMESRRANLTIVPILVGGLSPAREAVYGRLLAPYLANSENLFIISSDFCHWGKRFQYTYYDKQKGAIWESIKALDNAGMEIIQNLKPSEFTDYLQQFGNTICGRHPIGILLQMIDALRSGVISCDQLGTNRHFDLKFLHYTQSERCQNMNSSSVSYATASLVIY